MQQPLQPQGMQQPQEFPASTAAAFQSDEKAVFYEQQGMQQQMPLYPPPNGNGGQYQQPQMMAQYPGGQQMADPYQQQTNILLLCGLCNQMVRPELSTVTKYDSNANIAGVICGFICPCFVLGVGGKAENVTVRLCPSCKVPI